MKKYDKIILIAAAAAVAAGAVICAAAIGAGGSRTSALEEKTKTVTEKITALSIDTDYDDITVIPRDTDSVTVHYTEGGIKKYNITSENGTLSVKYAPMSEGKRKWYEWISFDFLDRDSDKAHKMVVEVPRGFEADINIEADYGDVEISGVKGKLGVKLDCGDIEINGCDLTALECKADYGDIEIKNTKSQNIKLDNDCGDTELEEIIGNIEAYCDLGDIEFENISGDNLIFKNSCGDIEGTVRGNEADYAPGADKRLEADTDLGKTSIRFVK